MPHVNACRGLVALAIGTLLTACASQPGPAPVPGADTDTKWQPPRPGQGADRHPQPPCAWSQIRGIAKLLSLTSAHPERQATWQFFPGDDILFHPAPHDSGIGDEFKALLKRPLNGPCDGPELYLVAPI